MRYLLDTTLLIDHAKGRPSAVELTASLFAEPHDLYVCDVIVAEALSSGDQVERGGINAMLRALEYLSVPPEAAAWAADSRRSRRATGPRSLADAVIGGLAWLMEATVVTRNARHFEAQGVPTLTYE
jgi:predicted nucleic acid-binding protein